MNETQLRNYVNAVHAGWSDLELKVRGGRNTIQRARRALNRSDAMQRPLSQADVDQIVSTLNPIWTQNKTDAQTSLTAVSAI